MVAAPDCRAGRPPYTNRWDETIRYRDAGGRSRWCFDVPRTEAEMVKRMEQVARVRRAGSEAPGLTR
jgi:hypothetical protein